MPNSRPSPDPWHHLAAAEVVARQQTDPGAGLSAAEAAERQRRHGPNQLTARHGQGPLVRLLLQFHQPLIYILLVATVVTAALDEWIDAAVILGVVLVNAIVGFLQEGKALQAIEALGQTLVTEATVIRGGQKIRIDSVGIVPGDVVLLQSGDKVPADLRLVRCRDLQIAEAALTGESVPVEKSLAELGAEVPLADRRNMAYASTLVTFGQGTGVVVSIGDATEVGRISGLITSAEDIQTPLTKLIARFSTFLLVAILILATANFLIGLFRGQSAVLMFKASVALAVSAIPEGLPAAVTIMLAIGVSRMATRRAIIRKMPAVETLGSTTVICSDKTGTLTQNQMTVAALAAGGETFAVTGSGYAAEGGIFADAPGNGTPLSVDDLHGRVAVLECLRAGVLCNDSRLIGAGSERSVEGDPTEAALLVGAGKAGLAEEVLHEEFPRVDSIPFESERQYMATLHDQGLERPRLLYAKGSVEAILARCSAACDAAGHPQPLDREAVLADVARLAADGLRVLAFARRELPPGTAAVGHADVSGMLFLGLQAMIDPPRPEAVEAVATCQAAGIRVKMITGDHALTAAAIASRLGLDGAADDDGRLVAAVTGQALERISDADLPATADAMPVFARVAPEQKLRLVRALQSLGNVVAMTGDGVNDAPALKQADIGVAMGKGGTDVAREASDMVLTDDNFASIEAAVEEGRGVFDNLTKFFVWTLPTNGGEALAIITAVILGTALPVAPVQILWINMTTAILLGLMLSFEPKEPGIMDRPPRDPKAPLLSPDILKRVGLVSLLLAGGAFGIFYWLRIMHDASLEEAQTAATTVFVFGEMFYLFNCRSLTRSMFEIGVFTNMPAIWGSLAMVTLHVAFVHTPLMNRLFHSRPLSWQTWVVIVVFGLAVYLIIEIEKRLVGHRLQGATFRPGGSVVRAGLSLLAAAAATAAAAEPTIRFDRDIRPILSEHCYACHGPGTQEAGLRLDSHEAATADLASGTRAIVAGDQQASEMLARIAATDPDVVMPPPHTNKTLSPEQRELLATWIAAGAVYEQHWSFRPVARPELPAAADPAVANPVDRFLEARLAETALPVNGEADRPTLLRRLSFALTGLPPTPAEVDAFAADPSPDAYERQVERLLASPHHGEEMARHWLDAARYADTHGLHLDNEREMWLYRDWVVRAFNDNLPFDQFTIRQLAGDLLPGATLEDKVATGFSRCNVTTSEGGSIDAELVFRYAVDRAATTTNAFMGLTGQCAVCHDHKFDPLSQREFYSLYAFFNSAADPGFDGNVKDTPPVIKVPSPEQQRQLAELDAARPPLDAALAAALAAVEYVDPATLDPRPEPERLETVWLDDEFPPGAALKSSGGQPTAWLAGDPAAGVLSGQRSLERTASGIGQDFYESGAAEIEVRPNEEIFAHVWLDPANPPKSVMIQLHTDAWKHRAVWGEPNVIPWGELGKPSRHHAGPLPEAGRWVRLAVPATALGLEPGTKIKGFALTQFDGHIRWDSVGGVSINDPAADPTRSLAAWWQARVGKDKLDDVPQDLRELVKAGPEKTIEPEAVGRIRRHWLTTTWAAKPEPLAAAVAATAANDAAKTELDKQIPLTFIFADLPAMRESFVMERGAYDKPGAKVERATPAFLPPLVVPEGESPDRLDLATWLVSADHPLTPRVAANRLWQQFFGKGLVKTSEDFGLQGEPPSHPDLLDWLAAEYRASGWDTRRMARLLVTSRAFRRASRAEPEQLAADPENRLLARGPRFRLDAEQIRDNALAVSGLLDRTLGGKGVKPYQPPNIWEPVGFSGSNTREYRPDSGPALYRRTLYTFIKRTAPHPSLVNFDAPNREQFCARRERSNTPLQALQLMNDTQHVEAARALAARALAETPTDDADRIEWLYRTVLARPPSVEEARIVWESLAGHRARYEADTEAAKRAISHGESPPPAGLAPAELAAWTLVANLMLNLDETLCRN